MGARKDVSYDLDHWTRLADRCAASDYAQKRGMHYGVTDAPGGYIVMPLRSIRGPVYYRTDR